jgi:intracellular multiplication protein IcmV
MAIKDIFKVSRKTFFNPTAWLGLSTILGTFKNSWRIIRALFIVPTVKHAETFEQAAVRLNLTEADIKESEQRFLLFALLFLVLGCGAFVYGFYLLFEHGTVSGLLLALAVAGLLLTQAFRFHFWFFQIKYRKLGCTFQEWRQGRPNASREPKP